MSSWYLHVRRESRIEEDSSLDDRESRTVGSARSPLKSVLRRDGPLDASLHRVNLRPTALAMHLLSSVFCLLLLLLSSVFSSLFSFSSLFCLLLSSSVFSSLLFSSLLFLFFSSLLSSLLFYYYTSANQSYSPKLFIDVVDVVDVDVVVVV